VNPDAPTSITDSPSDAGGGTITTDDAGNVVIGAPTAIAIVTYPNDGDPED
jgi:hypothetical protein